MRLGPLPPLLAALLLAACGSHQTEVQHCASSADCAADAFCRAGRCSASASPVAVVSAPSARPLRSHTILRFDGSLSHDPDPEDRVATFAWSFRATGAACEPFPPAAGGQAADVVFPCGGAFEVALTVVDATGHAGAPAVLPLTVEPSPVVPGVSLGPDVTYPHRCAGAPLVCGPELPGLASTFSLAAVPTAFPDTALTYAWTVIRPVVPAGAPEPRVTFDPPDGPNPAVRIETDGTSISGEYLFGVTVSDPFQLAAVAQQRVTIGNRPPTIAGGGVAEVHHAYDAGGARWVAAAAVPAFTASDPDGDPVLPLGFAAAHAGDGTGSFEVVPGPSGWDATFAIAVPHATQADGRFLRGGPGLSRSIAFAAADPNGGRADVTWDVQVLNRPPRLAAPLAPLEVDHFYDPVGQLYRASAPVAAVVDDDGDPLEQAGTTSNATCATLSPRIGSGPVLAQCTAPYTGPGSLGPLVGTYAVAVQVADPWDRLQAGLASVTVKNRPPVVDAAAVNRPGTCGPLECCAYDPDGNCMQADRTWTGGAAAVPSVAHDPDGDPLELTVAQGGCGSLDVPLTSCTGTCPTVSAHLCGTIGTCAAPVSALVLDVTAGDGLASATGTVTVAPTCQ